MSEQTINEDAIKAFSFKIWSFKQGEMVSMMIHLGDRLGIYQALDGAGSISAAELAEKTGLHERWLLEWLKNQAAAGLLNYQPEGRFELTDVGSLVLVDEENSMHFAAGAFGAPTDPKVVDRLADAFKTGIGLSYEELGPSGAHRTERMLGPWTRYALPKIIPALDGVEQKLKQGGRVADIGCGAGLAIATIAELYPEASCHGFDPSASAIELGRKKIAERGISNLDFHHAGGEELPTDEKFDFIITFDCMHDMTRPDLVIDSIRKSLKDDGTWLIKDIKSFGNFERDSKNPFLAMMYGFSITACMSSALSEPDGLGLGTLGFHQEVVEQMTLAGGFGSCTMHDFDDPSNFYYEVRV